MAYFGAGKGHIRRGDKAAEERFRRNYDDIDWSETRNKADHKARKPVRKAGRRTSTGG